MKTKTQEIVKSRKKLPGECEQPVNKPDSCPVMRALELIANKWTVPVIYNLYCAAGPLRFGELQRKVNNITQKELTKRLRELERAGLIERRVYPEVPPRVEYELTEIGITLFEPLSALSEWAKRYSEVIDEHRRKHGVRAAARSAAPRVPSTKRVPAPAVISY